MNFREYTKKTINESSTLIKLGVTPKQLQAIANKNKLIPDAKAQWTEIKSKSELKKVFTDKGKVVAVINPDGTLNLILKSHDIWDTSSEVRLLVVDSNGKLISSSKETIPKALSRAGKGKYYYTKTRSILSMDPEDKSEKGDREASLKLASKVVRLVEGKAKKLYEELKNEVKKEVINSLEDMDFVKAQQKLNSIVGTSSRFMSSEPNLKDYKSLYTGGDGLRKLIANILDKYSSNLIWKQDMAFKDASPQELREAAALVLKKIKETNDRILANLKEVK